MMDFLTKLCLTGAAVLFAAWLVLKNRGRIARAADELSAIPFRRHALFLAFVAVAAIYGGAKNGTNDPPQGASPPMLMMGATPAPVPLFSSASVSTNDTWDFSAPPGATVHERWRLRGAADDWFPLFPAGWSFALGDTSVTNLRVFSRGKSRLPDGTEISPLPATLGIVPEINWQLLGTNSPSLFWHSLSADGSLLLTWQNVLLHRAATNPVSVQAELRPSGGVTFRYDLSRLASDDILSGIVPSAGRDALVASADAPLTRNVTGVSFKSRDEAICDEARAAFEEALGDLDPFSCPEGSTNTVLEHLFYSGTTNGAFFYPQTNDSTAVLRVAVSGSGSGDLLVGGSYVPLVAPPQMRGGPAPQGSLMLPVSKWGTVPMYLRGDSTLSVSFDSGEFAFGELPSIAANRCAGWINFPDARATEPCIHDLGVTAKAVSPPASSGADGLSCTWQGGGDVEVENHPPRSATLTASFDPKESGGITYALSHPKRLFGQTEYAQTVRYCPRPGGDEPPFLEYWEEEHNVGCVACPGTCAGDCGCPASCGCSCCDHGTCPVHSVPYVECESLHPSDYEDAATNAVATLAGVLYIRDPPVVGDQVYLEVPSSHVHCCGCPDHWTNYVGLAYRSQRISVTGPGGQDFSSTATSCTVDVAGVAPSEAVGDAELAFARNGEIYKRRGYTVLGVGMRRDGVPLSRYNELSPSLGFPMSVCTNQWNAPELMLVANVGLPTGGVRLELEDATGQFAVWCRDGEGWRKLVDCDAPVADFPMHGWKAIMRGAGCGDSPEMPVRLTSASPGGARLVFRYWNVVAGAFVEDSASQRITSVNPPLLVDYDRNRFLDAADVARYIAGRYVYFWMNDDKWKGDNAFETFLLRNSGNDVIDGRNDLINFLPIAVDIAPFASHWDSNDVYYRLEADSSALRHAKLAFADIAWSQIGDAPLGNDTDIYGNALHEAPVFALGGGTNLPPAFASLSQSGRSSLLMEFPEAARGHDLRLNVYSKSDGAILFSSSLRLHVGEVSKMLGWENLRSIAGGSGGMPTRLATDDWPAEEHEPGNVVFVHGYNMEEDVETPLWAQNVFKKLWWAGLDRGFIAVQWRGNEGQSLLELPLVGYVTPNYYGNVQNAFATASALKNAMDGIDGPKWFVAHSLGNMLVSAAIQDYGMPYERYFMLNAAVAIEAFDPAGGITQETHDNMTPESWTNYVDRVRATHWFECFPEGDGRRLLTWKGRFANVTNIVNFYSTQEEVVCNGDGRPKDIGREYSWYNQEYSKGNWTLMLHQNEGGWAFNSYYDASLFSHMAPSDAAELTDAQLQEVPFFLDFANQDMHTSSNGLLVATNYLYRAEILAYAIPSESYAVGANPILGLEEMSSYSISGKLYFNHNMAVLFTSGIDDLPENGEKAKHKHRYWQHSTFVQRSYKRVHQLFKIIDQHIKRSSQ